MQKMLLLVCLQTSMVLQAEVKDAHYNKSSLSNKKWGEAKEATLQGNSEFSTDHSWTGCKSESISTMSDSYSTDHAESWAPGASVGGKSDAEALSAKDLNKFNDRKDREDTGDIPVSRAGEDTP